MVYKKGTKVVHKTHGVGTISGVETLNYGSGPQDYYLLVIDGTGMMVRFPIESKLGVVRTLVSEPEIGVAFEVLRSQPQVSSMVWNRRKKELMEKLNSGSLTEMAEIVRDLVASSNKKELSYSEKEVLSKARSRIVNEVSAVRKTDTDVVNGELNSLLNLS
tara:strand:+ start:961 stop:1443 length:483 start_codon:yes stop_codon:yes gene_type:complete